MRINTALLSPLQGIKTLEKSRANSNETKFKPETPK